MNTINKVLKKGLMGIVVVSGIITITACTVSTPAVPSSDVPAIGEPSNQINNGDDIFTVDFEKNQKITSGSTMRIPLNVKGATVASGNGIAGYHITLMNLPAYVSKAVLMVDGNYWPVISSDLTNGSITFYGENADKVLTSDKVGFFVLELTIGTVSQSGSFNIAIDLADNAVPSGSHSVTGTSGSIITLHPR